MCARRIVVAVAQGLCLIALVLAPPAQAHHEVRATETKAAQLDSKHSDPSPPRDKCKKTKGSMGYPEWCTDPGAGFMTGTFHKAEPTYAASQAMSHTAETSHRNGQPDTLPVKPTS